MANKQVVVENVGKIDLCTYAFCRLCLLCRSLGAGDFVLCLHRSHWPEEERREEAARVNPGGRQSAFPPIPSPLLLLYPRRDRHLLVKRVCLFVQWTPPAVWYLWVGRTSIPWLVLRILRKVDGVCVVK